MSSGTALGLLIHGLFPSLWGEPHANSILELAAGNGMISIPRSRGGAGLFAESQEQMLAASPSTRGKLWPTCWTAHLPSQPISGTHAVVPHSGHLIQTLTFCPHCSL